MKRWAREDHHPVESGHFVVYLDEGIPRNVATEVLDGLEFGRDHVGRALSYYSDDKVVCNLYKSEQKLRNICVGLPLGFVVPRRAPLAYVLGGEVHGRLFSTASGSISRLWVSTFAHEYCHVMFKEVTGRQYYLYAWLQEGLGEYFRQLYLQEKVVPPEFSPTTEEIFLLKDKTDKNRKDPDLYLKDSTHSIWTYNDWEVRDALRYDTLKSPSGLSPKTVVGYWRTFNTPKANQIYAISSSLVEYLVNDYGWGKMRELLNGLRDDSNLDRVMTKVYGFDQAGLDQRWRLHLKKRWPDPWQPNIAMLYLVRGNWEIDGHESGIRIALADRNIEAARRHRTYLESRRVSPLEQRLILPVSHAGRTGDDPRLTDPVQGETADDPERIAIMPPRRTETAPAVELYEAAMAAYSMGQFAEGVEHLQAALQAEPEQIKYLRVHLARGLWLTGERNKAVELYKDELLEAKELPFINEVAWCFEREGEKAEALRLYKMIAESSQIPGLKEHALRRIDRLSNERDEDPALTHDKVALIVDPLSR
jgi:tetratricopeptide (TPR) repeat protein